MATLGFPLRFNTEQQKKKIEDLAKENGRSANSHILFLIDRAILYDEQNKHRKALYNKTQSPNKAK